MIVAGLLHFKLVAVSRHCRNSLRSCSIESTPACEASVSIRSCMHPVSHWLVLHYRNDRKALRLLQGQEPVQKVALAASNNERS
jgi:hypothetical protein